MASPEDTMGNQQPMSVEDLFDYTSGWLPPARAREIAGQAQADPELAAKIDFMRLLNPDEGEEEPVHQADPSSSVDG
jgi:hypothetical protein